MLSSHAVTTERLVNVLQNIALKQLTGRLSLTQGSEPGEIFFVQGNTAFARTTRETGETALYTMLQWKDTHYSFFEGEQPPSGYTHLQQQRVAPPSHSTQGRTMLPIELEETRQTPAIGMPVIPKNLRHGTSTASPTQPRMSAIFRALPLAKQSSIINQLDRKDRLVFLLLDGKRTLHSIKHLVNRSDADVIQTLVRLLKQGYIEYIQG
ncbi:MAG TPA: DUF4388 domain-containing protein [Ktedonobacteraceae bacterium]|nr:DUF4388 domain-containing protein [Ktedonobacteraceae bacterium]